ncbi:MAG: hypothetical protein WC376_05825 [Candidatus Nanoarchaeia archaeon]|jgi:hypothetical protein
MWESPIYKFEEETTERGRIVKRPFSINVTYSAPRNLDDPKKALIGVFNKITNNLDPKKTNILDIGAAKLRNTLWLLQKGFNVWAVEFPELKERLPDAKEKWELASTFPNFHSVIFPRDFIKLNKIFDIILLINEINVMPIPMERFVILSLCREKIKDKGILLWHQWRGLTTGGTKKYSDINKFIDGYLMGPGPNHTFYVEYNKEQTFEMLYSVGFSFNDNLLLNDVEGNSCYSYIFKPDHESLISKTLNISSMISTVRDPNIIIKTPEPISNLELYLNELRTVKTGREEAHKYHILSSRIFFEIFKELIKEPVIEQEINDGRGRIDIVYRIKNVEGIFKDLKDLRDIPCPEIMVECKNYKNDLTNTEYSQLIDRLSPHRGMLGFLLCRDKVDKTKVINHCRDRYKGDKNNYIIVLDDNDLINLAIIKLSKDNDKLNDFINKKIKEIID